MIGQGGTGPSILDANDIAEVSTTDLMRCIDMLEKAAFTITLRLSGIGNLQSSHLGAN
jgi:hypothetical protein